MGSAFATMLTAYGLTIVVSLAVAGMIKGMTVMLGSMAAKNRATAKASH